MRVLEELEAQLKEMNEREIQCSDTQAKQGILERRTTRWKITNLPEWIIISNRMNDMPKYWRRV